MSTLVNVADFKNKLAQYLALVEQGNEVIVCRRNKPIARCEAVESKPKPVNRSRRGSMKGTVEIPKRSNRTQFGSMKGTVEILGDLTEPLIPEEDWEMLK